MIELNTILLGDVYAKQWDVIDSSNAPKKTPSRESYVDLDGATRADAVRLNRNQAAPASGRIAHQFVAPVGATQVELQVDAKLPATFTNQTIVIGLYQVDGTTVISETVCVLTTAVQRFTCVGAVVAGTEYRCQIHVHNTGKGTTSQATALVTRVRLIPLGSLAAPFNASFARVVVHSGMWHDNLRFGATSRKNDSSAGARLVFRTNSTVIAVDYLRQFLSANAHPGVYVDGKAIGVIPLVGALNSYNITTFTLPPGVKTVEIYAPLKDNSGTIPAPVIVGSAINALYVPSDVYLEVLPPMENRGRQMMVYGDSISAGHGCTDALLGGVVPVMRQSFPGGIICEAHSGRQLAEDCGAGTVGSMTDDATKRLAFVRRSMGIRLTDIVSIIGTNDYNGASWTLANFSTSYGNLMDDWHAAHPGARIWIVTPLLRSSEVANGLGDTLAAYRTQIGTLVSTRAWATLIDGTTLITPYSTGANNLYFDTVHPNENGHASLAEGLRAAIGW